MERGSCRTCKHLHVYKEKETDRFWTYFCEKKKEKMDNKSLNLLWICHEDKDNFSLDLGDERKKKSIWKNDDEEESIFDDIDTMDLKDMLNCLGDFVVYDVTLGRYVIKNSRGNIVEICDKEYTKEYRGTSPGSYYEWKKEQEKKKNEGII